MSLRTLALLPLVGLLAVATARAEDEGGSGAADGQEVSAAAEEPAPGGVGTADAAGNVLGDEPDAGEVNRELRTVEEEVNRLKERVFRSKATLQLLKELVIEGATMGSRVVVWHINKMGAAYTVESVQYFLDGKNVYNRVDPSGGLDSLREIKIHEQAVPPGTHNLQVNMVMRGNGLGVFSYLRTYSFKVQSSYSFKVEDGRATMVRVVANERSGPWRSFVDRPSIQYEEKIESLREE